MNAKTATPLPYALDDPNGIQAARDKERQRKIDAYPQLVAVLRNLVSAEEEYGDESNAAVNEAWGPAKTLLRSLGEE